MSEKTQNHSHRWLRRLGWVILLLAAGFWTLFTGAEAVSGLVSGEATSLVGGLMEFAVFVAPLWLAAILVWRWPLIGAAWLLLDGAVLTIIFAVRALTFYIPPAGLAMTTLTLALPPLATGVLFLVAWWRGKIR
jgi:hypothetical protein